MTITIRKMHFMKTHFLTGLLTSNRHIDTGLKILAVALSLTLLSACSTVRDVTDWVPGVDSNEQIKTQQAKEAKERRAKEQQAYKDKALYEPRIAANTAEADAKINVLISKKYSQDPLVKRDDIGIEVNAGVVTLMGSVNSEQSAVKAIALARSTRGVSRVISKLVVIQLRSE